MSDDSPKNDPDDRVNCSDPDAPIPPKNQSANGDGSDGPPRVRLGPWWTTLLALYLVLLTLISISRIYDEWPEDCDCPPCAEKVAADPGDEPKPPATPDPDAESPAADETPADTPPEEDSEEEKPASDSTDEDKTGPTRKDNADLPCGIPFTRELLLVFYAGLLGGLVHALRSLYLYIGFQRLYQHWAAMYALRPFLGGALAVVVFLALRASLMSFDAFKEPPENPQALLLAYVAIAALSGMFADAAAGRLRMVSDGVFGKPETTRRPGENLEDPNKPDNK